MTIAGLAILGFERDFQQFFAVSVMCEDRKSFFGFEFKERLWSKQKMTHRRAGTILDLSKEKNGRKT